ncbi:MAG: phosphoglycerate kinase [Alphaproteobacteria bacterium]|nr:phosphoglycerate kinase [Alphaproteobacteria bacterium]
MPDFLTLDDLSLRGKIVLLRADLNVPMKDGRVTDTARLERLLPTLKDLAKVNAKIVILSHFGRPEGKPDPKYTLRPVAKELERIWEQSVSFAEDCIGPKAEAAIQALGAGQILVLENTRFHAGEEANDPAFTKALAALGEAYVNDAFSAAHRAHASTEGLAHLLPAGAGRLMQAEVDALTRALTKPEKPLAALVGGSKISTKLELLHNLTAKVDILVLGGGMANTFLAAKGVAIGKSISEPDMYDTARAIMAKTEEKGCHILLPKDAVVAPELKEGVAVTTVPIHAVPADQMILDIGPAAAKEIKDNLDMCKTVVWNGPLGAFEFPPFDRATNEVAICVADLTKRGKILSVAGGGDTVAAMTNAGVVHGLSYLSAAGGAFLEWLEGKELPGVVALRQAVPKVKTGKVIM